MEKIISNKNVENETETLSKYSKFVKKKVVALFLMFMLMMGSFLLDVANGPGGYSLTEVLQTIFFPFNQDITLQVIIWDIRLPVAITAILIGMMLAIAGVEMQTILNNPLAEPYTLGISAAASFGASLAIIFGLFSNIFGEFFITASAFSFAMLASLLVYYVSRLRGATAETMILVGICLLFGFSALLTFMEYISSENQLQQIVFWMMGSLGRSSWSRILICLVILVLSFMFFLSQSWKLTAVRTGDEKAMSLGVNVNRVRLQTLAVTSLLAATAVSFVGVIGFIGIVSPHISRMFVGEDQRFLLPMSAMVGGLMLSLASLLSKSIISGVIFPISIITSLIGIPIFFNLIVMLRKKNWS